MPELTWLPPDDPGALFPPVARALDEPNGLLAAGGDLSPSRLLRAYRGGIFPWYSSAEPILWWSPDPRAVIPVARPYVSRRLQRTLRSAGYRVSYDRCFERVVAACAAPRPGGDGTWITPDMQSAYGELHRLGHAHSVEVWRDDELAGGLYGVAVGPVFSGESMFSHERDASKVAVARLCTRLHEAGFELLDGQVMSGHLQRLGARPLPRDVFVALLGQPGPGDVPGHWRSWNDPPG